MIHQHRGVAGGCGGIGTGTEEYEGGTLPQARLYPWAAEVTRDSVDCVLVD